MMETLGHNSRLTRLAANNLANCANVRRRSKHGERILLSIPELSKAVEDPSEIDLSSIHAYTFHVFIFAAIVSASGKFQRSEMLH